jgi:vesicle-associated membrane protein 72
VESVRILASKNVDSAIKNYESVSNLEEKTETLLDEADAFKKQARRVNRFFRCRYYKTCIKLSILVALIVAIVVTILYYELWDDDDDDDHHRRRPPFGGGGGR